VFGHNAPAWKAMSLAFRQDYTGEESPGSEWPNFEISSSSGYTVDLDGSHADITVGSWVVLSKPAYRELWQVSQVAELSRAEFAISGKVTRLTLTGGENYELFEDDVRDTTVFAVSAPAPLADAPDENDVAGDAVDVDVDVSGMRPGRRLLVRGRTTSGVERAEAVVLEEVQQATGRWRLVLEEDLEEVYERGSVIVHGNVARATHGETVHQLLGSGRADTPFQRFDLAHAPLTYVQSADPAGVDAALEVRVNDVRWDDVATLFGAGPADRAFTIRVDEQGRTSVQFGDGARGARLPTGNQNVRARYRKGLGSAGNVGEGSLSQLLDRPLGVKGAANPVAAAGGVDPEDEKSARASMPLAVRTLGRAVSLLDYEDFARAFAGVAKAHATVLPLRGGRTVVVTVALVGSPGPEGAERLDDLVTALRDHGDPQVAVEVVPHRESTFRLALRVLVDPAYETDAVLAGVERQLRTAYAFDAREFVEPVHRSDVVSAVHSVAGVAAVDVDRLYMGTVPGLADRLLAPQPGVGEGGTPLAAGLLLLDPAPFDWLQVMM
jgi:predicted phage baseplate assembly protein